MNTEWIINPPWQMCQAAANRWQVPPLVAQILHNRGIDIDDCADDFLCPSLGKLIRPEHLPGATEGAEVVADAIERKQSIVLYGDYDVDGMTGVAILWHLLRLAGAKVDFYVPSRFEEGYGLNVEAVRTLVADGADLIISIDCGITGVEAAEAVRKAGARMVITDHHRPGETLPEGVPIVHPTVGGAYPNENLCGAGVAFKLAWAIAQRLSGSERVSEQYRTFLRDALVPAALGTIADVVPLTGENRIIARHGLALLPKTPYVGLRALIDSAGLTGSKVSAYDVGFQLAPRLNAAGRMGHARLAVELLTRADESRAREITLYLEEQNRARRSTERRIANQAFEMVERQGLASDSRRAIVLAAEGWHAGVIGIVASRVVDRYGRPTVMIALEKGRGQGSGRSIPNFDLAEALGRCAEHLISSGGHAMAAGLKIEADRVDAFAERFCEIANNSLTGADLRKKLRLDAEVALSELDMATTEALQDLGPFGAGNPRPKLVTQWVELAGEPRCVGKTGSHLQAAFTDGRAMLKAIAFGKKDLMPELKRHRRCKVAFEPIINEFNGSRSVEMQVLDLKFPES